MSLSPVSPAAPPAPSLLWQAVAEGVGTYMLVLFGCGAVHSATLTGAQSGLWQVAIVWGVAIMLAIYTVGGISGGHINPAITLALAAGGRFPWQRAPHYIAGQLLGAFLAAATLFYLYGGMLAAREQQLQIVRGEPGSDLTAMCYGEYFPNPAPLASSPGPVTEAARQAHAATVTHAMAFGAEVLGTLILALVVFAVTDPKNSGGPPDKLAPVFIGLTVAALISIIAPLTQACFNPARDFGPRLFAWLAGWRGVALPGPNGWGWLTVYILAPILGAQGGAAVYHQLWPRNAPPH